jgi:hypothetical protein
MICPTFCTTNENGLVNQILTRPFDLLSRGEKTRTSGLYVPNVARYQLRHTPIKQISALYVPSSECSFPPLAGPHPALTAEALAKAVFNHRSRQAAEKVVDFS